MRITIDLDSRNPREFLKVKNKLLTLFGSIDEIWLSSSKKGYHFIIYDLPLTHMQNIIIRQLCNDDKMRIWLDQVLFTKKPFQVLWTQKGKKKAKLIEKNVRSLFFSKKVNKK